MYTVIMKNGGVTAVNMYRDILYTHTGMLNSVKENK